MRAPEKQIAGGASPAIQKNYQLTQVDRSILKTSPSAVKPFLRKVDAVDAFCAPLPPSSNTGGKVSPKRGQQIQSIDKTTGYVLIDWCSGTFPPYPTSPQNPTSDPVTDLRVALNLSMGRRPVLMEERGKGWLGYEKSYEILIQTGAGQIKAGLVGRGGNGGKCHFSITGEGCALIEDWAELRKFLTGIGGYLSRVDLALDDLDGSKTIEDMRYVYEAGGFDLGGRRPNLQAITNSDEAKGDTLNIGSRAGGKLIRCYEKGKQLGDPESPWLRVEAEIHRKDRVIPLDILTRPVDYLAGAIPWIAQQYRLLGEKIRTIKEKAKLTLAQFLANLRQQAGKAIGWLSRCGVSPGKIVDLVGRDDGTPKRLAIAGIAGALFNAGLIDEWRAQQLDDAGYAACPF